VEAAVAMNHPRSPSVNPTSSNARPQASASRQSTFAMVTRKLEMPIGTMIAQMALTKELTIAVPMASMIKPFALEPARIPSGSARTVNASIRSTAAMGALQMVTRNGSQTVPTVRMKSTVSVALREIIVPMIRIIAHQRNDRVIHFLS